MRYWIVGLDFSRSFFDALDASKRTERASRDFTIPDFGAPPVLYLPMPTLLGLHLDNRQRPHSALSRRPPEIVYCHINDITHFDKQFQRVD